MYHTINYDSWIHFKSQYTFDIFDGTFCPNVFIFRGQRNSDWSLVSSFDRQYQSKPWIEKKEIEKELIDLFKTNCERGKWNLDSDDIGIKSLAQHYGIPTRLLDWSYSPFIAAYFAFSSKGLVAQERVAIWALKKDHEIWNSNIGVTIENVLLPENDHQKRQLGCFTLINNQESSLDEFESSCTRKQYKTDGALIKMTIPASEYKTALYELDGMNINATTVYGGLEGCAQAAKDSVRLKYLD